MTKEELIAECAATISWLRDEILDEVTSASGSTIWAENLKEVKKTVEHCLYYIQENQ